jgi:REP element-mobilizing transposase RayT
MIRSEHGRCASRRPFLEAEAAWELLRNSGSNVIPGLPHHVVQRGVRRMDIFFSDNDRTEYLKHLSEQGERFGVSYLAWCLMSNHIHLIAIPAEESSLARRIGEAHRRYTRCINFREGTPHTSCLGNS